MNRDNSETPLTLEQKAHVVANHFSEECHKQVDRSAFRFVIVCSVLAGASAASGGVLGAVVLSSIGIARWHYR